MNYQALLAIVAPWPGAAFGGYITSKNVNPWYNTKLKKPSWRPPNKAFSYVWSVLYTGMGYASYLVWRDGGGWDGTAKIPLMLYSSQLVLNWIWTPLFFGKKKIGLALAEIMVLDINVAACIWFFKDINTTATVLMVPYLAWGLFATALNYSIYNMNRDGKHLE